MGLGVSLFLSALGAILIWAVNATVSGVNIHTVGWILLIVGVIGCMISLLFLDSLFGRSRPRRIRDDDRFDYYN